jgi:hypothetical protein
MDRNGKALAREPNSLWAKMLLITRWSTDMSLQRSLANPALLISVFVGRQPT